MSGVSKVGGRDRIDGVWQSNPSNFPAEWEWKIKVVQKMGEIKLNLPPSLRDQVGSYTLSGLQIEEGKLLQLGSYGALAQAHQDMNHEWNLFDHTCSFLYSFIRVTLIECLSRQHFDGHKRQRDESELDSFLKKLLSQLEKDMCEKETDIQHRGGQPTWKQLPFRLNAITLIFLSLLFIQLHL